MLGVERHLCFVRRRWRSDRLTVKQQLHDGHERPSGFVQICHLMEFHPRGIWGPIDRVCLETHALLCEEATDTLAVGLSVLLPVTHRDEPLVPRLNLAAQGPGPLQP